MSRRFKVLVRNHLLALMGAGASRREVANQLGLPKPNFLSMVIGDREPDALLPLVRVPALARMRGLTGLESLRLVVSLFDGDGPKTVTLDKSTLIWLLQCAFIARKELRGAR